MRILYHFWQCPLSRKVRVVLAEKKLEFQLTVEPVWERRREFLALNPAGEVPVLVEPAGSVIVGGNTIAEYLDEIHPEPTLIGTDPSERAEVRRLVFWFDRKFDEEVTINLVGEKVTKRLHRRGEPDSRALRAGRANIGYHLEYIAYLTQRRNWLGGDRLTLADITAAAHLSCIDYIGDVPWHQHPEAKDWYARIKSRPSFRPLLADRIPGLPPTQGYDDLDF